MRVVSVISEINHYRGQQNLYRQQAPEFLDALREVAIIQSTEASNAIEGIRISTSRLKQLMRRKLYVLDHIPKNMQRFYIRSKKPPMEIPYDEYYTYHPFPLIPPKVILYRVALAIQGFLMRIITQTIS